MHRPFTSLIGAGIFAWLTIILVVVYTRFVVRWIRGDEYMRPWRAVALLSMGVAMSGLGLLPLFSWWSAMTPAQIGVTMLGPLVLLGAMMLAGWVWYRLIRMCAKKGDAPDA